MAAFAHSRKRHRLPERKGYLPVSLVTEEKDGMRVDFLTREFYMEKRGVFQEEDL